MDSQVRSVTWEAPEHYHIEKGGDWFLALAIITIAVVVTALIFGNTLFAFLLAIAGGVVAISASKVPRIIPYAVTLRGIRVGNDLYPYTTLHSYHVDENDPRGPQLLIMTQQHFMPLLVIPIPEEYMDEIEDILGPRLPEEFHEEPFFYKLLEFFGF
jgi:hypothetical protein